MQKLPSNIIIIVLVTALAGLVGYLTLVKKPSSPTTEDGGLAKQALITYFNLLETKQYSAAATYHGSGYEILQSWNPDINPDDRVALLKNGCEVNGWQCLEIKNILDERHVSQSEFRFLVQFEKSEWSTDTETVFTQESYNQEKKTDFEYIVKKTDDHFIVMTPPIYVP